MDTTVEKLIYIKVGNLANIIKNGKISFNLPGVAKRLTSITRDVKAFSVKNFEWYGKFEDDELGNIVILSKDGLIFGYVNYNNTYYELWGLSQGNSVFIKRKANLKASRCPTIADTHHISSPGKIEPRSVLDCTPSNVRILILTTREARQTGQDLNQRANVAVASWNSSMASSNITNTMSQLVLAGVDNLDDFTQNQLDISGDVGRLAASATAQSLRNKYSADVVVLFTNTNYIDQSGQYLFLGYAQQVDASNENAYAINDLPGFNFNPNLMTHEVGHLFGGRHQNDFGPQGQPYAHGHFFGAHPGPCCDSYNYATIMYSDAGDQTLRYIDKFSNPNQTLYGQPTGDAATYNVARRIDESTARIANFKPEPITVYISGNPYISSYGSYTYTANTGCGTAPFSYQWTYSTDGLNYYNAYSSSQSLSLNIYPHSTHWTYLRVLVTDANGAQTTVFINIGYGSNVQIVDNGGY